MGKVEYHLTLIKCVHQPNPEEAPLQVSLLVNTFQEAEGSVGWVLEQWYTANPSSGHLPPNR